MEDRRWSTDVELVRGVLAGDREARGHFGQRMGCVGRYLAARNRRLAHPLDRDELLDVAQDVQLAVWRKLPTYEGRAALETWVYRFCHLGLLKWLERRRRSASVVLPEEDTVATEPETPDEPSGIDEYLRHLAPREAEVTRLRHVEQLEFGEIAAELGISVSSAKTHYYRAVEKLRDVMRMRYEQGAE